VNTDAPEPIADEAEAWVLEMQIKLHRWAGEDEGRAGPPPNGSAVNTRGEPGALRGARPVRRAGQGDGPAERPVPRPGSTPTARKGSVLHTGLRGEG
jgi:hypothetical protein